MVAAPLKNRPCSIEGCDKRHAANGLCRMHYMRVARQGHADLTQRAKGTGTITSHGYLVHGKAKRLAHVIIAERALGRPLPAGAEVHHVNEIKDDNRHENLVVCPSRQYHFMLHQRARALASCGNANYRKCPFCKLYDDPTRMKESRHGRHYYHVACKRHDNAARQANLAAR